MKLNCEKIKELDSKDILQIILPIVDNIYKKVEYIEIPKDEFYALVIDNIMDSKITYNGTINGENKHILFKLENIPALPFGVNENFEIYHDQTLYYFVPDNIRECVKWSVVEEQMYEYYTTKENIKKI